MRSSNARASAPFAGLVLFSLVRMRPVLKRGEAGQYSAIAPQMELFDFESIELTISRTSILIHPGGSRRAGVGDDYC